MRILHTSDWHLGRSFHREGMLGHQAAYVDHLLEVVEAERVELVVVSGDVYDRALPPVDAVRLANETFTRLSRSRAQVVVTSGNHDSAQRLGFGAELIDAAGVFIRTRVDPVGVPVLLGTSTGRRRLRGALPRSRRLRSSRGGCRARSHEAALAEAMSRVRADLAGVRRHPLGGAGARLRRREAQPPATPSATSASAGSRACRRRSSTASTTPRWATCTAGTR